MTGKSMLGCHLSIAGGLHNALIEAQRLETDCLQIFTANQRQWKAKPITDQAVQLWRDHLRQSGVVEVVSHGSYLVNLAAPAGELRDKSLSTFRQELLRCESLGIRRLAVHPGSHAQAGEELGLQRVVSALDTVYGELKGISVLTCLEITAGQGSSLGSTLEQLQFVRQSVRQPESIAVCLDTAHMLAAGYDLASAAGARATLEQVDAAVGLNSVKIVHINDSKAKRRSHVDRHAHIGLGHIPLEAFAEFINHPALADAPKILETPKEQAPDGRSWDQVNLETLRKLLHK